MVLLHAGTGSSRFWRHQLPAFAGAGRRVITYDRRGHGRTEAKDASAPASDDLGFLLKHLGIERVDVVGTAAGAIVALDYALAHPAGVRRLVLANTHLAMQDEDYAALQKRLRPSPQFDALPADVKELGPSYRAANPDGVKLWLELEREARQKGAVTLPKTRAPITYASLANLIVPTLLITGDADLYMPPPVLRLIAEKISGAQSTVVAEAGHSVFWEQPERFNKAVLDFLGQP